MDAGLRAHATPPTSSSKSCQSENDMRRNDTGCNNGNNVWTQPTSMRESPLQSKPYYGHTSNSLVLNGSKQRLDKKNDEGIESNEMPCFPIDEARGSGNVNMSDQRSHCELTSGSTYVNGNLGNVGVTVIDRVKAWEERYSIVSEKKEDISFVPDATSPLGMENTESGTAPLKLRRKTLAELDYLPSEVKNRIDIDDGDHRMALRRNSMMWLSKSRESRDSVESMESRKTSMAESRKSSSEQKPGPSLRRARFALQQFLKRGSSDSVSEIEFYRRTSHDVTRPETAKGRTEILRVLKDTTSHWKKVNIKLDVPIQEVWNSSKIVRLAYIEDIQAALQIHLGSREAVVILKSRKLPEILTSSDDDEHRRSMENSEVDDSRYLDKDNQRPLDNMAPQNHLSISNDVRRLSISNVISTMKSESDNCQSQINACVDMERFADDDDIEVLMKKQEAISGMVAAMSKFMDNTELHLAACKTLVALSTNSEASCVQMCRENGVSTLLQVVRTHEGHTPLLLYVLEILGNISLTEELSEEIIKYAGHSEILATMSRQRDDYKVAKLCCFILGNLVNTVDVAQAIMFVGGVHSIIGALQRFPTNAEVLENGCRALGCFSAHDEICMDVVNAGAVEAVLVAMAAAPEVDTLQECGCWALACLTKFEESCVNICNNNGISTIVTTLEKFRKDEALQEYGCWTISNLSAHEQTLNNVVNHRVLKVVMDAMCAFPDNLEIQHQIFFAIGQIVMTSGQIQRHQFPVDYILQSNDDIIHVNYLQGDSPSLVLHEWTCTTTLELEDEMQENLVKSGGVRSAVNIMMSFPDSQELQEHGCRILGNVAVNEQLRKLIENDGGSKAVVAAMLTHDRHEQIQTYGCMALTNITADVPENKGKAATNSGVSAVLATIKEMAINTDVVLCGLKALCNLVGGEDASYYFMENEGLETMGSIIYRYKKRPDVQRYTCRILASVPLAPWLEDTCLDATEDVMYEVLNCCQGDSDVNLSICHYYENLVLTEAGRSRFNAGSYLDKLAHTMTLFKDDKAVQMSGCKTIAAISMYKNSAVQKGELCVSLVLDVMKIFHACSSVQTVCCGAISYLSEQNENLRNYILRKGGLDVMMANLHEHPGDEGLVVVGLMALDSITHTGIIDSNRLQKEIEFVSRMMKRYSDNLELQIYSCNILSAVGKEGVSWCDCARSEALEPVTCILKRRRSNPELESTALEVLTLLLSGESEDIIQDTREKLPFLDDEFWEKCYRNVLHID